MPETVHGHVLGTCAKSRDTLSSIQQTSAKHNATATATALSLFPLQPDLSPLT